MQRSICGVWGIVDFVGEELATYERRFGMMSNMSLTGSKHGIGRDIGISTK